MMKLARMVMIDDQVDFGNGADDGRWGRDSYE
jgi:hypothetical protein